MYGRFQLALKYLTYWIVASNGKGHGVHSPFVYDFIRQVLADDQSANPDLESIASVRKALKKNHEKISILDLGAGSGKDNNQVRTVAGLVRHAAKSPKFGRLFYRLVRHYGIESVLELGTSLGMSTRYFAKAAPLHGVTTIEGAPALAAFTRSCFVREGYGNIRLLEGDFAAVLPSILPDLKGRKLIFVDGNHRYAPTIAYFRSFLPLLSEHDILVFDDIHWSQEMEKAWEEIKNHQQVACTIDVFFIGIVFFKREFKEKQHFIIRF